MPLTDYQAGFQSDCGEFLVWPRSLGALQKDDLEPCLLQGNFRAEGRLR